MSDIHLVAVVDGLEDLLEDLGGILFLHVLLLYNQVKEFSSCAKLGNEVDVLFVLEVLIELEDIWVVQVCQDLDLIGKPLGVGDLLLVDGLACSDLTSFLVQNPLHSSESTRAQNVLLVDLVELADGVIVFVDHVGLLDHDLFEDLTETALLSLGID